MRLAITLAATTVLLSFGSLAVAQSADERAAARGVVKKNGDAVVMVLATLKIRANVGGQEQTIDQQAQANGTILDASGLAVLSLSTLQPDDMMARSLSNRVQAGTRVDVTSEPSGIRMHLSDGREIPAKLILRDQDLDLAFIRPVDPPSPPIAFIDAPAAKVSLMDLLLIVQRTSETTGWLTTASFATVELVIDKPRVYYQVASGVRSALGSPIFDTAGKFVGVMLVRNTGARASGAPAVLPADDIRDVAKQAK